MPNKQVSAHRRPRAAALALALVLAMLTPAPGHAGCDCGPDFCQDDARIAAALKAKKQSLAAAGYPDRLVGLLDVGQQCVARITRSPDAFTMLLVESPGHSTTFPWSADDEARARRKVLSGELARYWIYNARNAFSCCKQKKYDAQPDYNATDDVSAATAIKCVKSGADVSCTR